jgi:hypothetical protein
MDRLELDLKRQSETVDGLLRVSQALLESNLKPPDKPKE